LSLDTPGRGNNLSHFRTFALPSVVDNNYKNTFFNRNLFKSKNQSGDGGTNEKSGTSIVPC